MYIKNGVIIKCRAILMNIFLYWTTLFNYKNYIKNHRLIYTFLVFYISRTFCRNYEFIHPLYLVMCTNLISANYCQYKWTLYKYYFFFFNLVETSKKDEPAKKWNFYIQNISKNYWLYIDRKKIQSIYISLNTSQVIE